ncbi:hypothetical protein ACFL7D_07355 [candidate division KSB1 bacterium]
MKNPIKTSYLVIFLLCIPGMLSAFQAVKADMNLVVNERIAEYFVSFDPHFNSKIDLPDFSKLQTQDPAQPEENRGGYMAGLKALFLGPRIGLESNENVPITFIEKANLFVPLVPFSTYSSTGIKGAAASAFLGPRVGSQLNERKIRKVEWLGLIPVLGVTYHIMTSKPSTSGVLMEVSVAALLSRIWPAWEAFRGKTMMDVERAEQLRR